MNSMNQTATRLRIAISSQHIIGCNNISTILVSWTTNEALTVDESEKINNLLQRSLKMYVCFDLVIKANDYVDDDINRMRDCKGSLTERVINFNESSIFSNCT